MNDRSPGYDNTPVIPGTRYRVHDSARPQPSVVVPPKPSTQQESGTHPSDAILLFDGTDLSQWEDKNGNAPQWTVENGHMEVVPGTGIIRTRQHFGDGQWHIEWAAPPEIESQSQGRGNSGVFLMGQYEVQVLDSYENPTYADGSAGAIYGQTPPLVNACRKPGEWQTFDIIWIAPRFDEEEVLMPARITVLHNGLLIHHDKKLIGPTTHKDVRPYRAHPETGPLVLQDHKNPVKFRNIWWRAFA